MRPIQMVDLKTQYQKLKAQIDSAVIACIESGAFINGPEVKRFKAGLEQYLQVAEVVPCANGTDALQIAMMALGLKPGDEVIVPTFTYVATAEVLGVLGLTPVMVDVDPDTFNITAELIEAALSEKTKAIVPVHLFGQSVDMEPVIELAKKHKLFIVEDNAQAIGAVYTFKDGTQKHTGALGHVGCTSFYPSKNLGAFGDGGALFSNDKEIAAALQTVANHGQNRRYYHDKIGVNSRLDSIQAAILNIKLEHLDTYIAARQAAAAYYDAAFANLEQLLTPVRQHNSTHVFHQYTLKVPAEDRDALKAFLQEAGVPAMIYYPLPLNEQEAFKGITRNGSKGFPVTNDLCKRVLSLPMHTELDEEQLQHITTTVKAYFEQK